MIAWRANKEGRPDQRRASLERRGGGVINGEVFSPVFRDASPRVHDIAGEEDKIRLGLVSLERDFARFGRACSTIAKNGEAVRLVLRLPRPGPPFKTLPSPPQPPILPFPPLL